MSSTNNMEKNIVSQKIKAIMCYWQSRISIAIYSIPLMFESTEYVKNYTFSKKLVTVMFVVCEGEFFKLIFWVFTAVRVLPVSVPCHSFPCSLLLKVKLRVKSKNFLCNFVSPQCPLPCAAGPVPYELLLFPQCLVPCRTWLRVLRLPRRPWQHCPKVSALETTSTTRLRRSVTETSVYAFF